MSRGSHRDRISGKIYAVLRKAFANIRKVGAQDFGGDVLVGVRVGDGVKVLVGVRVGDGVKVGVRVGVSEGTTNPPPPGFGLAAGLTILAIRKASLIPER